MLHIPFYAQRLNEIAARNEALISSVLAITGKSVFADASKDPLRARFLEGLTGIEPHVVHLVRHPMGYVSSRMKSGEVSIERATRYWNRMAAQVDHLFAALPPERSLRIRYEDLCANTEQELSRISTLLNVAEFGGPTDYRASDHHIIGNRMRLSSSSQVLLDESWRERLRPDQIDRIRKMTCRYRERFNYE